MASEMKYSFQTGKLNTFSVVDYVLFGIVLAVSAGIGIFYAIKDRKRTNTREFLMAGGNMGILPVSLSLLASFMSAITLLGTPGEMYLYTTMYWWIGLSYLFVAFGAAHVFIPIFFRLKVTSAYEYLEYRFSRGVRTAGSMTFCVQMLLYMAIVLYAPSLALNIVTGFTLWGSVIAVGSVCTLYTCLGGMKAVLWTDTFQVGMMLAGLFAILIKGSMEIGGFGEAWKIAYNSGRIKFDDFDPNPAVRHSVWSLVIGGTFTWVAIYGTNQAMVQRCCTCPTLRKAQIALWVNFPGLCAILYICCLIGIAMFGLYSQCDPFQFNLVNSSDQLLPLFVMDVLGNLTGFPGLFVACLFSGALRPYASAMGPDFVLVDDNERQSRIRITENCLERKAIKRMDVLTIYITCTISSGLNSLSAVFLQDVVKTYISPNITEERATLVSKILALIFGVVCLGLTYVASLLGSVLQAALSLFGMIGGPLLGLFILGMIFPWANKWGAYAGLFLSLVFMFWIGIGAQIHKPHIPKSPVYTYNCNCNLTTTLSTTTVVNITSTINPTMLSPAEAEDDNPVNKLYTLSYMWYSATAVLTCVVVGLIVSFFTKPVKPQDLDGRLFCPLFDILFPYLPEKIRKPMRFGVNLHQENDIPAGQPELPISVISTSNSDIDVTLDVTNDVANGKCKSNGSTTWELDFDAITTSPVIYDNSSNSSGVGSLNGVENSGYTSPTYDEITMRTKL